MLRESAGEKWAILVFAYNRPKILYQCAQHLYRALALLTVPCHVYLHLDKPPSAQIEQDLIEMFASGMQGLPFSLDIEKQHQGVWSMSAFAARLLERDATYTHLFLLEEDALLACNALQFAKRCSDWCHARSVLPAYISCWSICFLTPQEKQSAAGKLRAGTENIFASLWQASFYRQVYPFVLSGQRIIEKYGPDTVASQESIRAYCWELFYSRKSLRSAIPASAYKAHLAEFFRSTHLATGPDRIFQTAVLHLGHVPVVPVVNRCINIGKEGLHCTEELWKSWRWDKITLDEMDEPDEYCWESTA